MGGEEGTPQRVCPVEEWALSQMAVFTGKGPGGRGRFVMRFKVGQRHRRGTAEYLGVRRGQGSTDIRDQARAGMEGVELRSGLRLNYGPRICGGPLGSLSSVQSGLSQRLRAFHSVK